MAEDRVAEPIWYVGDRVELRPRGDRHIATGTIVGFDEEGLPRGVRVRFDHSFNGADSCYATRAELTRIESDRD